MSRRAASLVALTGFFTFFTASAGLLIAQSPRKAIKSVSDLGAPAKAHSQRAPQFMSKQCNEDAIRVHLDPHPFQQLVGTKFSLVLEDGKAVLLILAQDCSQYWLDGKDLGPTQEIHVWLSIDGPSDTRPIVGAQITRPTMTWVRLFDGSTNLQHRNARMRAGSVLTAIEGVSLDPPGSQRGGRAYLGKGLVYSWRLVSAPPPAHMVGVNHDVRNPGIAAAASVDQIQALVCMSAAASPGTLQVTGSNEVLPWIQVGSYPISVNTFFPVWVRGNLGASQPGR